MFNLKEFISTFVTFRPSSLFESDIQEHAVDFLSSAFKDEYIIQAHYCSAFVVPTHIIH